VPTALGLRTEAPRIDAKMALNAGKSMETVGDLAIAK
jgi:hypothetical protein